MIALKRRTVASAPRCASHSRRMRVMLSRNLIVACVVAHADKLPPITTVAGVPITTVEVAGVAIGIAGVGTVVVAVATVIVIATVIVVATVIATTVGSPIIVSLLWLRRGSGDRKSTRLNSSHLGISYAVF